MTLAYHVVDRGPLIVLMPSDYRLTASQAIHPRELIGEVFIAGSNTAKQTAAPEKRLFEPLHHMGICPSLASRHHDNRSQGKFSPRSVQRDGVTPGISTADAAL
jgi:hypothetical protein